MKPSKGIEDGGTAWNRWVKTYKKQPPGEYLDHLIPIRLRGYSEIVMSDLTDRERKAIDTTLRRGYALSQSPRWCLVLDLILSTVDWDIGYLGKTQGTLWFPNKKARDACRKHMEAQLVMTEKFRASDLRNYGPNKLYISVGVDRWSNDHLKAHFTELRQVADAELATWKRKRVLLANKLKPDTAVVRVPFDSKKDDDDE
jgi:hypothetical protein